MLNLGLRPIRVAAPSPLLMYQPVKLVKTWTLLNVTPPESGSVGFIRNEVDDEQIKNIPLQLRVSIISSLLALQLILECEDPKGEIHRLGWPDEAISEDSLDGDEVLPEIKRSLEHLSVTWKFEYTIARQTITDLNTALYCISKVPNNQMVGAFCPKESKGFARAVSIAGVNNPASVVNKIANPRPSSFEEIFKQILAKKGLLLNGEEQQPIVEIDFE